MNKQLLALSCLAGATLMASAASLNGSGTQNDPYTIATASQWNDLAEYLAEYLAENETDLTGYYVKITADIAFDSETAITPLSTFDGDLDGGDYTISGVDYTTTTTYQGGLIAATGTSAYIHNLTVKGSVSTAYNYTGGVVGQLYGKLSSVVSYVDVTSSASYTAGLAGASTSGAEIESCYNYGTVSGSVRTAGIVATATGTTIKGCTNEGAITGTTYVAGIASYISGDASSVTDCVNNGAVTSTYTATSASTSAYVAGVAAYQATAGVHITNCTNNGAITAVKGSVSGIAGRSAGYVTSCVNNGQISGQYQIAGVVAWSTGYVADCVNYGAITPTGSRGAGIVAFQNAASSTVTGCVNYGDVTSSGQYAAGISCYTQNSVTISECVNYGDISSSTTSTGGSFIGGITGYLYTATAVVTGCENHGDITASQKYAGGIAGYTKAAASVELSENTGTVASSSTYAGGIMGYTLGTVSQCFNTGDVSGTTYVGGVAGYASAALTDVYNAGDVSGTDYVGGIVGQPVTSTTTITNGYTIGALSATGDNYGNLVGVDTSTSGSNLTESVYYLEANNVSDTDGTSEWALTYSQLAKLSLGDNWTSVDDYSYPILKGYENDDYALAYSAAVIPATDDETYSSITSNYVYLGGTGSGVTWAADEDSAWELLDEDSWTTSGYANVSGEKCIFDATDGANQTVILTATSGEVSVETTLIINVLTSGVEAIEPADGRVVASEKLYTVSGIPVVSSTGDGAPKIYIVRRTYTDGTTETLKIAK